MRTLSLLRDDEPDRRTENVRRLRRVAFGTVILLSAALFLFSLVAIARVGIGAEPSPSVVSAAREAVEQNHRPHRTVWGEEVYYESPTGDVRYDWRPCRRERRSRPKGEGLRGKSPAAAVEDPQT
jgi:hypothetical protein